MLVGLALLWGARIAANRFVYVSELGADGEPTAWAFRWALLLVAVAALIVAAEATPNVETMVVHDLDLALLRRTQANGTVNIWPDRRTDLYEIHYKGSAKPV